MRERAERSKQSASEGTPEKQHEGQRQFEGVTSKMSDLHWVNKSVGGKRADWNYDISHPSHSPESINDIMFKHQESQEKP